ncbi:MAG: penicillin acylase family protein [Chloroflexi bacterium]|nr:penicillin acylase family protein [Chloroflexota bacterium]
MSTKEPLSLEHLRREAARRLPPRDGQLAVKGLDGPVRIVWDRHGVPHAKATSAHDMWFAQGFLHAQDRLWGMERTRRFFHGTLAEIVGEGGLGPDRLFRRVGLMRAARQEWPHLEQAGRLVVEAYTAGVNAYLDLGFPLPIEFEVLGYTPARWEPTDVTGRWKLICDSQSMNGLVKLARLQVLRALGPARFAKLFPFYPPDAPTIVPPGQPAGERAMAELLRQFEEAHAAAGILQGNGSNNWAVDGTLTESGHSLLAGDPHLAVTVPSFWHVQHIEGPEFSFIGASMPGVPGVTYYGHNGHTAWSLTTAGADAQDLFLEQVQDGDPPRYLYQGEWRPVQVHTEEVRVKGRAEPLTERVLETHHGPIVSGGPGRGDAAVALRWSGMEVQQTFSSFVAMHSARDVHGLIEAHRQWTSHTNRVLADHEGNIAYLLSGQLPIRKGGPAHLPVPGWTGEHEWAGQVPFEKMPRVVNPRTHFVNTSNNLIVSYKFPHYVAPAGTPYRAQRVVQMLRERAPFTVAKFAEMQGDQHNIPGARMAARVQLVQQAQPATELGKTARDILAAWDGNHTKNSAGGAVYEALCWKVYEATLGRLRERMAEPRPSHDSLRTFLPAVLAMVLADDRELLSPDAFPYPSWDALLAEALDAAGDHLHGTLGDPSRWAWGALHAISFRHGVGREEPAASLLNVGTVPVGGSGDTVNNTGHGGGPAFRAETIVTYRQIIDLGDFSKSVFILPPGNSGHVAGPHYRDMLEDYLALRYRPLLWDWGRIEGEKESEQGLRVGE